jgi:hypothetical protein
VSAASHLGSVDYLCRVAESLIEDDYSPKVGQAPGTWAPDPISEWESPCAFPGIYSASSSSLSSGASVGLANSMR